MKQPATNYRTNKQTNTQKKNSLCIRLILSEKMAIDKDTYYSSLKSAKI